MAIYSPKPIRRHGRWSRRKSVAFISTTSILLWAAIVFIVILIAAGG